MQPIPSVRRGVSSCSVGRFKGPDRLLAWPARRPPPVASTLESCVSPRCTTERLVSPCNHLSCAHADVIKTRLQLNDRKATPGAPRPGLVSCAGVTPHAFPGFGNNAASRRMPFQTPMGATAAWQAPIKHVASCIL